MRLAVKDAARIMNAELVGEALVGETGVNISRVVVDSRMVREADMFVALEGLTRDGHNFLAEAADKGASCALVGRVVDGAAIPQLVVSDQIAALTALAGWVRDSSSPLVVGITGSTGKTTTKDLLASVSRTKFATVVSEGNFNNELGVPLTILGLKTETEVLISELGARGRGQIKELCGYLRPHIGVVTNVGVAHYEMFGSQEAIAETKAELVAALPEGGAAILNADDPMVDAMASRSAARVIRYGLSSMAEIRAERVTVDAMGRPSFRLRHGGASTWVDLPVSGQHQVSNALAAAAAGIALGIDLDGCRLGLEKATLSAWRMQVENIGGVVLVNDSYNANPASMAAALQTSAGMKKDQGRLIAVLGYMAELGEIESTEHLRLGALVASVADKLICVGKQAGAIAEGARTSGMHGVDQVDDAAAAVLAVIQAELRPGDVVLAKGSRAAALESVTTGVKDHLLADPSGPSDPSGGGGA